MHWLVRCAGCNHNLGLSSFVTCHQVCDKSNTMGVTNGAGTAYSSGAPEFTHGYKWGSYCSIFSFLCSVFKSSVVLLSFFYWPYNFLSFDLQLLVALLWYLHTFFSYFAINLYFVLWFFQTKQNCNSFFFSFYFR